MRDGADPFPVEGLDENRGGHLTRDQALRFERMVGGRRRSAWGLAVPVGAIGALLLVLSGPASTTAKRHLAGWGFLAAAAVILVAPAFDPLAADVRDRRVETVQGAVSTRRIQSASKTGMTRYYLNVAGLQLRTSRLVHDAAPIAGHVGAYYLPRTRWLVSLERLPNPPLPSSPAEARDMLGRMARAFVTGDSAAFADARADAAGVIDAFQDTIAEPTDAPGRLAGGQLAREAMLGTWTHPLVTVTLADDGTATVTSILGASRTGHWTLDAQGRLLTDVTGTMAPTDAALEGDRLTIQLEGRRLTLTRSGSA